MTADDYWQEFLISIPEWMHKILDRDPKLRIRIKVMISTMIANGELK